MTDRDYRAIAWLEAQHGPDWYIGNATVTDWRRAYAAVDAASPVGWIVPLPDGSLHYLPEPETETEAG